METLHLTAFNQVLQREKDMGIAYKDIEYTEYIVACCTVKLGMIVEMLY